MKYLAIFRVVSLLNLLWIIIQEGIYSDEKRVVGSLFINPDLSYIILGITLILTLIRTILLILKK